MARLLIICFMISSKLFAQSSSLTEVCFPMPTCKIDNETDSLVFKLNEDNAQLIINLEEGKYKSAYLNENKIISKNLTMDTIFNNKHYEIEGLESKVEFYITLDGFLRNIYTLKDINSGIDFDGWAYYYKNNKLTEIKHWNKDRNDGLTIFFNKRCEIIKIENWDFIKHENGHNIYDYDLILGRNKPSFWYRLFH